MKVFRFILLLSIISTFSLVAQKNNVNDNVLCYYKEKPLSDALREIRAKTGINFIYQNDLIENIKIDGIVNKNNLHYDLNKILLGSGFESKIFGNNSVVIFRKKKRQEKHIEAYVVNEPIKEKVDSILTMTDAELLTNMELDYPAGAVRNREHGNVDVKILVNNQGDVCKSILQTSSGSVTLDSVALAYTKQLRFNPASTNGKPRSTWVRMIFKYFLTER